MATYSERDLDLIFAKAQPYPGYPGYALDCDGRIIGRHAYGQAGDFGWEVDHVIPSAIGGLHAFGNVRPRHWMGNSSAGGLLGGLLNKVR